MNEGALPQGSAPFVSRIRIMLLSPQEHHDGGLHAYRNRFDTQGRTILA